MPKFLLLLSAADFSQLSPAEVQEAYGKFFAWSGLLRSQERYVDGAPLERTGKIISSTPSVVVSDGPFAESKEAIGGYFIIEAADLDDAVEVAKGCPNLLYKGSIEVRPMIDTSNM